jgi:two-component system CheB/CheR fusion protein
LRTFFENLPDDTGLAYVVIVHLAADHESLLADVLQHSTRMPVNQVQGTERLVPNRVYVIPPGKALKTADGFLVLGDVPRGRHQQLAVDFFFRALADSHGPHATAIVLSGVNTDGAIGIKRIKERGGLAIAQDPDEAEHDGMPQAALATGMVDWVLPVADIPRRLVDYYRQESRLKLPPETAPEAGDGTDIAEIPVAGAEAQLLEVLAFLRKETGRDFSVYKRATILRRIARRMQVNQVDDLQAYLDCLQTHPAEARALLQDLLISVTNFFRDADAFEALRGQLDRIYAGKNSQDAIRVWVPGCATGEEAYSIGILLDEYARTHDIRPLMQIIATDVDEAAIRRARDGLYPFTIEADVSEERLRRFFVKEQQGYRVSRELREGVLFATHDALKDSPFSRLDLVSCRNLMIYLAGKAQARLFDIFHYALVPNGLLFLGSSESVDDQTRFEVLDKKHRIYAQRPVGRRALPVPVGLSTLALALDAQTRQAQVPEPASGSMAASRPLSAGKQVDLRLSWGELHVRLLELLGPPSILVDSEHEILHLSPNAGRFLQFAAGEPTRNLLRAVNPDMRIELRAALFQAAQSQSPVEISGVTAELEGGSRKITIRVMPANDFASGLFLVIFDARQAEDRPQAAVVKRTADKADPTARYLDSELERLRAQLRDTIEQYETSAEDLKASNEELQAMNEELRSATEELETSREELQSINEELTTVNHELKLKVDELANTNSDMLNLMDATEIATVFLDRQLRITRYTPPAVHLFHLIESDIGRPLADLRTGLEYGALTDDARRVLERLVPVEREVCDAALNWYLARLLPYRTLDDHIAGVVLTLVDISERKNSQELLRASEERMRMVLENVREYGIFWTDTVGIVSGWNTGAERLLGYTQNEAVGQSLALIFLPGDRASGQPAADLAEARAEGRASTERTYRRKDGTTFFASSVTMSMTDHGGELVGFVTIIGDRSAARANREALEKKRTELAESLRENERARASLEKANQAKDRFLAVLSHELRTPLTPIVMATHLLRKRSDLPADVLKTVGMIQRNARIETSLINDLLDLTRITRGKLVVAREQMNVHTTIHQALEICSSDIEDREQSLELCLDAASHCLAGDQRRLQQAFWNLVKNASKFTPKKGSIVIRTTNVDRVLRIAVTDSGVGIAPEHISRIFEAFSQEGEWVAREFGGLGLGLAIARATVEAHGGTLTAASPGRGHGATFTIDLPLAETGADTR